eukprot:15480702-Alexandrium_andersonii.AAC.1
MLATTCHPAVGCHMLARRLWRCSLPRMLHVAIACPSAGTSHTSKYVKAKTKPKPNSQNEQQTQN